MARCTVKRLALLMFGLTLTAGPTVAGNEASKEDLKKLAGKWKTVTIIHNGAPLKLEPGKGLTWVFSGNKLHYTGPGAPDGYDEITLDASKKPKTMDSRVVRKGEPDKHHKAIYELEGDRLKLCVDIADKGRPTEFESTPGSGRRLLTLERVKE
jgi:uncharacterized protein (TIGR03067 family)